MDPQEFERRLKSAPKPIPSGTDSGLLKSRRLSFWNWLELLFGVALPGIFLAPFLLSVIALGLLQVQYARMAVGLSMLGLVCIFSLWLVIIFGPNQINQHTFIRTFILWTGIPGLILCGWIGWYFLTHLPEWGAFFRPVSLTPEVIVRADDGRLVGLGLLGPFLVGLRYLPALFKEPE